MNTHVTLKSSRPDGTIRPVSGDLELVSKLTDLPVGEAVVLVRFIRDLTDSEMASHADVLTLEQLGSDETVMTFSASESEYRIHVRSRNDDLSQTILVALAADLSLTQKAENQQH